MVGWDGDQYQQRFDDLAGSGAAVHGEADLVMTLAPSTVLDAGCGTGRVAIELTKRGVAVVGADRDASMIATARRLGPAIEWHLTELADLDLDRRFDVVVMAGNVPLFTPADGRESLVAACGRHLESGGALLAGFSLDGRYGAEEYDHHCTEAGLKRVGRWSTWSRKPFPGDGSYLVSLHRAP